MMGRAQKEIDAESEHKHEGREMVGSTGKKLKCSRNRDNKENVRKPNTGNVCIFFVDRIASTFDFIITKIIVIPSCSAFSYFICLVLICYLLICAINEACLGVLTSPNKGKYY